MIYFILDALAGSIKIGCASDPARRLSMLQTGNPRPLQLLGVVPGGLEYESVLHKKFATYLDRGEWFTVCPELTAAVHAMIQEYAAPDDAAGPPDFTHMDNWSLAETFVDHEWKRLQTAVRTKILTATRIPCTAYLGREPFMTGSRTRRWSFQIMPDSGPPESHPFWGWHVDGNPQWFPSPGRAVDSWISSFRFWRKFHRELAVAT